MRARELARLFERERAVFARRFPAARRAWLSLDDRPCPAPPCAARDYAQADLHTGEIVLAFRALLLPPANVRGLLRHELGHLVDPRPEQPGAERRADRLARIATGRPILYDAAEVQTDDPRAPYRVRPRWLPR